MTDGLKSTVIQVEDKPNVSLSDHSVCFALRRNTYSLLALLEHIMYNEANC